MFRQLLRYLIKQYENKVGLRKQDNLEGNLMTNWNKELNCVKCGKNLDLDNAKDDLTCSKCNYKYEMKIVEISYALSYSSSGVFYKFKNDKVICKRYFNNPPLDTLEEAYQDSKVLTDNEVNPQKLLPIVKNYHDALKMRVRRLIELNDTKLSIRQKEKVLKDSIKNPEKSLNIKNLFDYLKYAFPNKEIEIDKCYKQNESMIKRIWWVRNKIEHISYTQWLLNAKIFEDLHKNPNDPEAPHDFLNFKFIKKVNNTVIDICKFILSLTPNPSKNSDLYTLNSCRI